MTKKLPLTRDEKEAKVKELHQRGMNIREISKKVRMSFSDIGEITRKLSGDDYGIERSKKYSKHTHALELFREGSSNLEVAIKVGLTDSETIEEQKQYRRLIGDDNFCKFYDQMRPNLENYLLLEHELRKANLSIQDAREGTAYARKLDQMKFQYSWLQNDLRQKNQMFCYSSQELFSLKNEINTARSQVEILNQSKDRLWSEIGAKPPNEDRLTKPHRRRRHARLPLDDSDPAASPIVDIDSKGSKDGVIDDPTSFFKWDAK